jgi:glycosyltransferase involved in cell wall biosynthesis
MRIDLVTETYVPEVNGVALTVQSLEDGLRRLGHEVGVVRLRRREVAQADAAAGHLLLPGSPLPGYAGVRFGLPAGGALHDRWAKQRPDAIYVATEGPLGWSALNAAQRLGIPVATGFHTRFDDYIRRYGLPMLGPVLFAWMRRFHNRGLATLVPTLELQRQLQKSGFTRVQRLGRAVDTQAFHPRWRDASLREKWGVGAHGIACIMVGRLAVEKNIELGIEAFRALQARRNGVRLVLVGDGPLRAKLEAKHPDIIFAGMLRGDALSTHFASADLFLFPSLSETFGNVTLEAMASGLACVAFDYGAAREHLREREHGACVPFGDEQGFVRAVQRLGLRDHLDLLGAAARHAVLGLHPDRVASDFADLLGEISQARLAA